MQETHYDPWGLELTGLGFQASGVKANKYLYNGKEMQEDLNLGMYDYGARFYDPVIGRWNGMDPLAEKFSSWTPYHFVHNNPIKLIDPDGRAAMPPGDYYDEQGNWLANDGIDDSKVYHADETGDITFGLGILKITQFTKWNYKISDSKLEEYFPTLLGHEGGFVNHPQDPGGATNKGITLNTFGKYAKDLLGVQPVLNNLRRITNSQAAAIYETGYWNPSGAGNISDKQLGWLHFDTYIHGGASSVLRNTIHKYNKSGKSIATLNTILQINSAEGVFNTYKEERLNRFNKIIESNPNLGIFKAGWSNRVNNFQYKTP